jgi:hypothetical protein
MVCKKAQMKTARQRRAAQLASGVCRKGHDLTLPDAVGHKGTTRKHWFCVKCAEDDRLSNDVKTRRERLAQHSRIRDKNNPDAPLYAEENPAENFTGGLTMRLLQLQTRLESAMPWERETIKTMMSRLAVKIEQGRDPASWDGEEGGEDSGELPDTEPATRAERAR